MKKQQNHELQISHLEDVMVFRDGGEGVAEALGPEVQQGLHEDVDLEGVEA